MKSYKLESWVGLFVLLGILAVVWLAVKIGAGNFLPGATYQIEARFSNVGGLTPGSTVLISGVQVGRVESIHMDPKDYSAIATISLTESLKLPTDTMASIKTTGLIGDKYVALSPGADETNLAPGSRITMTESSVDIESLIGKMAFGGINTDTSTSEAKSENTTPAP